MNESTVKISDVVALKIRFHWSPGSSPGSCTGDL